MADTIFLKHIKTQKDGKENGWMIPIYNKEEPYFSSYNLNFVYASCILAGNVKGPHLHKKRECRLVCIKGEVELIVREEGEYRRYILSGSNPNMVTIKAGNPFMVRCGELSTEGILLNFANHIWKQEDQDNYVPEDWNYKD